MLMPTLKLNGLRESEDVAITFLSIISIPSLYTVVQHGREKDAVTFMELYQRLCSQQVLKSRSSLLHFMFTLASDRSTTYNLPSQVIPC